ncbi:glycoside hydrolase family 65 protein [Dyella monticola]|uniref:Glycoside hydrolase family 65 protein n=1 Tax=Dyella monticola TaxID=1927958 RepID=A0A370X7Q0_9GAMM|nr:glycoside hydrolase family 65 protein [Dyella monticola]RDS84459.1 glycoside hydrolase family 65 protein [Dyella monticola]
MTRRHRLLACLVLVAGNVFAATDPSFLLTASSKNWANYFPGQLGNGYVSTLTAPRGTEGNLAYMTAFMDYAQGDVSRPAAVPGWTGIDYSTGSSRAGEFWLNQVDIDGHRFQNYTQTLDMYNGVLTTRYNYVDGTKVTGIEVKTFVSQASHHLAVTQFSITPDFDGDVKLSFQTDLWAPHQPRFALGKMDGPQMQEAVFANNLKLQPIAPATPDRAPLWYHGDTHVLSADGDTSALTLWLQGKAEQGARMAQAVALGVPKDAHISHAERYRSDYRLALDLRVAVQKGRTYTFTKYVAMSRDGWGGADAMQNLAQATAARNKGFGALLAEHEAAWHTLWQSDIEIDGDPKAQQMVHSDLYYLLSNAAPDTSWPIGACGMTPGYTGHIFWDSDTWVFPALLLLHPDRAKSLVMYRSRTLDQAEQRARARGLRGAMYPWEADPDNGSSQTPHFAWVLDEREIHVNADIAIAQWQYYEATQDRQWLVRHGWPVIRAVADFWASRATYHPAKQRYDIDHVTSVDEDYSDVPNDTFTNAGAQKALRIAAKAAAIVGEKPDPHWAQVADGLHIPFSKEGDHYLDFDETVAHDLNTWGGSSLPGLSLPALDVPMSKEVRARTYDYAITPIKQSHREPNSMGYLPLSISAAMAGYTRDAERWFQSYVDADVVKPPFNVRTETASNNTGYFMTASGGFLQNLLYGFTGLRIQEQGLEQAYPPMLPVHWTAMTLKHITFRGKQMDITLKRNANGEVILTRQDL